MMLLTISQGKFYRNGLNQIVMIVGLVPEDDRFYAKGYRFVDNRGSYYTNQGVTAKKGMFTDLNIVSEVPDTEVIPHDVQMKIQRDIASDIEHIHRRARINAAYDRIRLFTRRVRKPVAIGAAIGLTGAAIAANAR